MQSSSRKRVPSVVPSLEHLERRHRILLAQLVDIGLVLRGSIAQRMNRCGNPTCRCKADPPQLHGPYNVWTRKVAAKTVTVVLRPEHASLCQQWTRNMRELDRIVGELQEIGLQAATAVRQHVPADDPCPPGPSTPLAGPVSRNAKRPRGAKRA